MCGPALPLVGAGVSALGAITGGLAANAQARFQAKIAERNAAMEREAGQQELQNTREASLDHYRKVGQMKGAQRARAAAGGVSVDMGTAQWVQDDTELLGREDADRIYRQGAQNVRGTDIRAANYGGEANAQRTAGTMALVKGAFDAGKSLLGGAEQYRKMRAK